MRLFRALVTMLVITALAYVANPYYHLYRIGHELAAGVMVETSQLVDLGSIRQQHKKSAARDVDAVVGEGQDAVSGLLRRGAKALTDAGVDAVIDEQWLRRKLLGTPAGSFWSRVDHAFFESPTRFLLRLGSLGDDPVHAYLELRDWRWVLTEVYD